MWGEPGRQKQCRRNRNGHCNALRVLRIESDAGREEEVSGAVHRKVGQIVWMCSNTSQLCKHYFISFSPALMYTLRETYTIRNIRDVADDFLQFLRCPLNHRRHLTKIIEDVK
jgi:hypothetical protein